MGELLIGISYVFVAVFFFLLIKARVKNEKVSNLVYVPIVVILIIFMIWGFVRNFAS